MIAEEYWNSKEKHKFLLLTDYSITVQNTWKLMEAYAESENELNAHEIATDVLKTDSIRNHFEPADRAIIYQVVRDRIINNK